MNQFIKPTHDKIVQHLDTINVDGETQKIVMREKTQAQIFDTINQQFGDQFTDFEDKVSQDLTPGRQSLPEFEQVEANGASFERERLPVERKTEFGQFNKFSQLLGGKGFFDC
jgi:hypothetical protein